MTAKAIQRNPVSKNKQTRKVFTGSPPQGGLLRGREIHEPGAGVLNKNKLEARVMDGVSLASIFRVPLKKLRLRELAR